MANVGMAHSQLKPCNACKGDTPAKDNCIFCNGTGDYNRAADSLLNKDYGHPCMCHMSDSKNCNLCGRTCHHNPVRGKEITMPPTSA